MQLVSVIIPTYECAKYVNRAVESVLNQTHTNVEIIVVDDGSTDNTLEVLKPNLKRIIYIYQPNKGLASARNRGLIEAKGDYIAFLDADDKWLPEKIELQISCCETIDNVHMVFTDFSAFDESGYIEKSYFKKAFPIFRENSLTLGEIFSEKFYLKSISRDTRLEIFHGNIVKTLFKGNFILPSSVLLRRSLLFRVCPFKERYKIAEETEFFLRLCYKSNVAYINYPLTEYMLRRPKKLTDKTNTSELISSAIEIQKKFIHNNPIFYRENRWLCRKAIGMSHSRLSYYFISELMNKKGTTNAIISIKWYPFRIKPFILLLLGITPTFILKIAKAAKKLISKDSKNENGYTKSIKVLYL